MIEFKYYTLPNCGPCNAIKPLMKVLSVQFPGVVKEVNLATDNPNDPDIFSAPSALLFKDGKKIGKYTPITTDQINQVTLDIQKALSQSPTPNNPTATKSGFSTVAKIVVGSAIAYGLFNLFTSEN